MVERGGRWDAAVRELLGAVLEAVSPPSPATAGDRAGYVAVLDERVMSVRSALTGLPQLVGIRRVDRLRSSRL
jgi:hypothetical protein